MADTFEKPEKFTKEWYKYIWYYYKWHIIATVFVVVSLSFFIYGKITATKPDLRIAMAGNIVIQPENEDKFQLMLDESVKDINRDGKTKVFRPMFYIYYGSTQTGADYQLAMGQKLSIELMSQDTFLFVFDKELAGHYTNLPDAAFLKTEKWAENISEELLYKDEYGRAYGVCLKESAMLKEAGIDGRDMYLFIRCIINHEENRDALYNESLRMAKEIIR